MERTVNKLETKKVKSGDIMATINWVKVTKVEQDGSVLHADDLDNRKLTNIEIRGKDLVETCYSASQFSTEVKVTKTQAAELLISSHNRPLTVCFEKVDGTERVMIGRLASAEPLLGRSHVEDLEITSGHRLRLVDHRTIKYLICEHTKYTVK